MANRDNAAPFRVQAIRWAGPGRGPLNRRVLYNRASADINGKPWDPKRYAHPVRTGRSGRVTTSRTSTLRRRVARRGPFIMQQEGLGRLFALDKLAEGPFPEHYEPMETPLGTNPLHPNVVSSPVVRIYEEDVLRLGKKDKFPLRGDNLSSDRAFPRPGPSTHGLTPSPA